MPMPISAPVSPPAVAPRCRRSRTRRRAALTRCGRPALHSLRCKIPLWPWCVLLLGFGVELELIVDALHARGALRCQRDRQPLLGVLHLTAQSHSAVTRRDLHALCVGRQPVVVAERLAHRLRDEYVLG